MKCKSCYYRLMCEKLTSLYSKGENFLNDSKININNKELPGTAEEGLTFEDELTFNNELITRFLKESTN